MQFSFESFVTVVDSSSLVDAVVAENILFATAYDTTEITEAVVSDIGFLAVSIYDSIGTAEEISVAITTVAELNLSVVDTVGITEIALVTLGDHAITVVDSSSVSEEIYALQEIHHITVYDSAGIAEEVSIVVTSVDETSLTVYSEILVIDSVSVALDDHSISSIEVVSTLESIEVTCAVSISTFDSVTSSDTALVALSDLTAVVHESILVVAAVVTETFQDVLTVELFELVGIGEYTDILTYSTADIVVDVYSTVLVTAAVVTRISGYVANGVISFYPTYTGLEFSCETVDLCILAETI